MAEKFLVPIYLPRWLHEPIRKAKRAFVPPEPPPPAPPRADGAPPLVNIWGERNIEWAFLSREMPNGPGRALEFGCEQGYMSLLAAQKGFHVIANDLEQQTFSWRHPEVEFVAGDFLKLSLPDNCFDLEINCSSVEHVGVPGRYGIRKEDEDGDIQVMRRLARALKPSGVLLMTAPCGQDSLFAPWCRVYGEQRLPQLLASFTLRKEEYWVKNDENQWVRATRAEALAFVPENYPPNPHLCSYALACFVLVKRATP